MYDGDRLLAEYDGSDQLIRNYFYGSGDVNPTILVEDGSLYYYYHDHLNTPQVVTDETGIVKWQATYKAFGEVSINTENVVNNFRFPGQYNDDETGLYYNFYRYYGFETGRYINEDPFVFLAGLNYYIYCLNNPIVLVDDDGLFPGPTGAIGGGISGAINGTITGSLSGGYKGGPLGSLTGGIFGGLTGGITGAVTGGITGLPFMGGTFGGVVGNLVGGLLGELTSPTSLSPSDKAPPLPPPSPFGPDPTPYSMCN